jgi:hypothetical protein
MLDNAKLTHNNIDLIIINGDQIGHRLIDEDLGDKSENKKLYKKTFAHIFNNLTTVFPEATILPVIGNNDYYEHYLSPKGESKREQIDFFKSLYFGGLEVDNLNKDFEATVSDGMYYSYKINKDLKFIMWNSIMYSKKNVNFDKDDFKREMEWLEKELSSDDKKILCMHIPPYPFFEGNRTKYYAKDKHMEKLDDLMYKYRHSIVNVFGSHLHFMKFGVSTKADSSKFLAEQVYKLETEMDKLIRKIYKNKIIHSSTKKYFNVINFAALSPISGNNPTYSVIDFNFEKVKIDNIRAYHADLNKTLSTPGELDWDIQYDFRNDFGFSEFDNEDIYDFVYNRVKHIEVKEILPYYIGGYPRNEEYYFERLVELGYVDNYDDFKKLLCTFKNLYKGDIQKCEEASQ